MRDQKGCIALSRTRDYPLLRQVLRAALEYERTPKAEKHYLRIRGAIDSDLTLDRFLYLVPNYAVMAFVSKYFWKTKQRVYFGLANDFRARVLETPVMVCGRGLSAPLSRLLTSGSLPSEI